MVGSEGETHPLNNVQVIVSVYYVGLDQEKEIVD